MLDEMRPVGLTDVAKQLGTDPFELMRRLVAAGAVPETLQFTRDQIERLRETVGKG